MTLLKHFDAFTVKIISLVVKNPQKQRGLHQFVKFAILGVLNTIIDFSVYYILTRHTAYFHVDTAMKYVANILSFLVATTFSFFTNRTWTFEQTHKPTLGEAARFYSTTSTGIVLNSLLLLLLIKVFGIYDLVAKIFSTFVTIFWNFILKRFWVFAPGTSAPGEK